MREFEATDDALALESAGGGPGSLWCRQLAAGWCFAADRRALNVSAARRASAHSPTRRRPATGLCGSNEPTRPPTFLMHDGVKSVDQQLDCRGGCPAFLASIIDARRQARKMFYGPGWQAIHAPASPVVTTDFQLQAHCGRLSCSVQAAVHQHETKSDHAPVRGSTRTQALLPATSNKAKPRASFWVRNTPPISPCVSFGTQ